MYAQNDVIEWISHIIDRILTGIFDRELRGFSENVIIYHLNISKLFFFLLTKLVMEQKHFTTKMKTAVCLYLQRRTFFLTFTKGKCLKSGQKSYFI